MLHDATKLNLFLTVSVFFLWTKYQHKPHYYDQIMIYTMLQYEQVERKFKELP